MKKYLAEMLGTFAVVFAGTGAVVANRASGGAITNPGIALTWGLIVMVMIYVLGDVSGAHMNPAVTTGFWIARRFPGRFVLPYVASQIVGALLASLLLRGLFGNLAYLGATLPSGSEAQSFVLEVVLTGMLMLVVLCVSQGPKEVGVVAGIAVGGLIGLEAMFAGPICGASMNPARSLAPALVSEHLTSLWVYLSAPLIGAAAAVPCWMLTRAKLPFLPDLG